MGWVRKTKPVKRIWEWKVGDIGCMIEWCVAKGEGGIQGRQVYKE